MPNHDDQYTARRLAEAAGMIVCEDMHDDSISGVYIGTLGIERFDPCRFLETAWHAAETICRERGWTWSIHGPSPSCAEVVEDSSATIFQRLGDTPARALSLALLAALEEDQDDANL